MDFWGFEGRHSHELPGEGFGLFMPPPPDAARGAAPNAPANSPQAEPSKETPPYSPQGYSLPKDKFENRQAEDARNRPDERRFLKMPSGGVFSKKSGLYWTLDQKKENYVVNWARKKDGSWWHVTENGGNGKEPKWERVTEDQYKADPEYAAMDKDAPVKDQDEDARPPASETKSPETKTPETKTPETKSPKDAPAPAAKDSKPLNEAEFGQTNAGPVKGQPNVYQDPGGTYYIKRGDGYHKAEGDELAHIQSKAEKAEKKKEREDDPEAIRARREGTAAIIGNALGGAAALKAASSYGSGSYYGGGPAAGYGWGGSFGGGGLGSFGSCGGVGGGIGGFGGGFGGIDLTGTGFSIQRSGGDYREDSRKTEALLQMLIMMVACGNVDAITTAFIMLSQKSKQTLIKASLQMINAMRQYDNQMREMSDAMGKLNSKDPEYQSKLAEFNSKFQTASGGRQMIMNMGRDIMSSVEEFNNVEKSVLDQMTRSRQTYSRWT